MMGWAVTGHYGSRRARLGRPIMGLDEPGWAGPAQPKPGLAHDFSWTVPCRPTGRYMLAQPSTPVFMGWTVPWTVTCRVGPTRPITMSRWAWASPRAPAHCCISTSKYTCLILKWLNLFFMHSYYFKIILTIS